uniref:N-acetyllactosaminide beta-1,3-N-acetylglucosaminyltransferase 2 n=1 Tax=Pristiophorus japonicus TaxID=55135 RepID=UPI00398E4628
MKVTRQRWLLWAGCAFAANLLASWALWTKWARGRATSAGPTGGFWKPPCPLQSLWNQEQHRLDQLPSSSSSSSSSSASWDPAGGSCRPDLEVPGRFVDFARLPRQMQDFLVYRRCRAYPLLLEPAALCQGGPPVVLLLAVKSQASSFARRQAVRQTWGGLGRASGTRLVFLLGRQEGSAAGDGHPDLSWLLGSESRRHSDLLQWDFRDTFLNLTLKEVLFLPWLAAHCPGARYVFKGDDDVFVNTRALLGFLGALGPSAARRSDLFLGDAILDATPARDPALKYYVPGAFYRGHYPPYAGGAGVVFSGGLAPRLARAAQRVPLFPIDDVFTGMCLRRLGLAPRCHPGFRSFGINETERWEPCAYRRLVMVHRRSPQEIVRLWRLLQRPNVTCA